VSLLLHIETATEISSVALSDGGKLVALVEEHSPNSHSTVLTLQIEKLFKEAQTSLNKLEVVVVSAGPGSFTGLRIGVSAAKGLCYALDKPLIAIPTLQAMAAGAAEQKQDKDALYCGVINSIKTEVYTGLYDFNLRELVASSPSDIQLTAFQQHFAGNRVYFFGNGAKKLDASICEQAVFLPEFTNSAAHLIGLAHVTFTDKKFVSADYFEPLYVKGFVAR
jgi:tRNA threonylcarbamoyladenosine biosynthesis protein TsaB